MVAVLRPKMWVYCNLFETIMVVRKRFVFCLQSMGNTCVYWDFNIVWWKSVKNH